MFLRKFGVITQSFIKSLKAIGAFRGFKDPHSITQFARRLTHYFQLEPLQTPDITTETPNTLNHFIYYLKVMFTFHRWSHWVKIQYTKVVNTYRTI